MKKIITLALLISSVITSNYAFASNKAESTKNEDFRCEKLLGTNLTDFKSALLENCNLNKPFSSSLSRALNDETYFYCCHKK